MDSERRRGRPLFADLLREVGAVPGIERVRYTSPHPKDLRDDTIQAMADVEAVCNHLHLPLQSGSDKILKAMHRGYTAERYLERLHAARRGVDDLAISTDIIIGFPGETDDDFARTLDVAAEAEYDSAYTFVFSPREGTEAAELVDQFVTPAVTKERMVRLRQVIERSAAARNACARRPIRRGGDRGTVETQRRCHHGTHATEQVGALPRGREGRGPGNGGGHRLGDLLPEGRAARRAPRPARQNSDSRCRRMSSTGSPERPSHRITVRTEPSADHRSDRNCARPIPHTTDDWTCGRELQMRSPMRWASSRRAKCRVRTSGPLSDTVVEMFETGPPPTAGASVCTHGAPIVDSVVLVDSVAVFEGDEHVGARSARTGSCRS